MTLSKTKEGQCPRCGSDDTQESDHYTVSSPETKNLIILQCRTCGGVFTEYYGVDNVYQETYFQEED